MYIHVYIYKNLYIYLFICIYTNDNTNNTNNNSNNTNTTNKHTNTTNNTNNTNNNTNNTCLLLLFCCLFEIVKVHPPREIVASSRTFSWEVKHPPRGWCAEGCVGTCFTVCEV